MTTMVIDCTAQLAPVIWATVAAVFASAGALIGLALPEAVGDPVCGVRLAKAGPVLGGAGGLLLAVWMISPWAF